MSPDALGDVQRYRAYVYATLPRNRPVSYTRKTLAARIGAPEQTASVYENWRGPK